MERKSAGEILGENLLGAEELLPLLNELGFSGSLEEAPIPFDEETLKKAASQDCILIWCPVSLAGRQVTLRFLREHFGTDPSISEPCFYNQDWYLSESFLDRPLDGEWHLVRKAVLEHSRAVQPGDLLKGGCAFPPAILCAWTFFAWYFARGEYLWWHDFVWCEDQDHNGDRIYVGKYHDIDGVNKNGFSVHRHLALRSCYAAISFQ